MVVGSREKQEKMSTRSRFSQETAKDQMFGYAILSTSPGHILLSYGKTKWVYMVFFTISLRACPEN